MLYSLHPKLTKEILCKRRSIQMSIDLSGFEGKVVPSSVTISITSTHPLVILAGLLPWATLLEAVVKDLKATTAKGQWWRGRKLYVRIHLAIYLLQKIYNLKDRPAEYGVRDNAAYQLFCGYGLVSRWQPPDHTKIEEFRSRLSPETQRFLANSLTEHAVKLGFADPGLLDVDSTAQEANISYPSDANLMVKLSQIGAKVISFLKKKTRGLVPEDLSIDLKAIRGKAKEYWFLSKNKSEEIKDAVFRELHHLVKQQMKPIVDFCQSLDPERMNRIPWHIRRSLNQINADAWRYLLDVAHFIRKKAMKTGKILSFHTREAACIKKGKIHKKYEFGRVIQLGRIKGNFLFALECVDIQMPDKKVFPMFIEEHARIFGAGKIRSAASDKGYFSKKNINAAKNAGIKDIGIQQPSTCNSSLTKRQLQIQNELRDRRAGIEPLIGHVKHGGQLGKSRMKSDVATKAVAYGSILGFNMRQLIRHHSGKMKMNAA